MAAGLVVPGVFQASSGVGSDEFAYEPTCTRSCCTHVLGGCAGDPGAVLVRRLMEVPNMYSAEERFAFFRDHVAQVSIFIRARCRAGQAR